MIFFFLEESHILKVHCWQALECLYYKPSNLNNPQVHYIQLESQEWSLSHRFPRINQCRPSYFSQLMGFVCLGPNYSSKIFNNWGKDHKTFCPLLTTVWLLGLWATLTLQHRNKNIVNGLQNVGGNFPQERRGSPSNPSKVWKGSCGTHVKLD